MDILEINGWKLRKVLGIEGADENEFLIPDCCNPITLKISIVKFVAVFRLRGVQGFRTLVLIQKNCNTRGTGRELVIHDDGGDHPGLATGRCEAIK